MGHRRMPLIKRAPYLTGDSARFYIRINGQHATTTHVTPELELPDGTVERLQPMPLGSQEFAFHPLAWEGRYRVYLSFEHISTASGFVPDYRLLAATLQVIDDYKPLFSALNSALGVVVGAGVILLVQGLS